jgi:hypothetical protein
MGILLEGPFTFEWKGGNVHMVDRNGERVCCTLPDFVAVVPSAVRMLQRIMAEKGAEIAELRRKKH